MKDAINQGGIKDVSESLLRAFNGAPRCAMVGERDITYDLDIIYSSTNQSIAIRPPFGTTGITPTFYFNPPFGLPFGRWLLDITLNMTSPVSCPFKLGLGQNAGGPNETQQARGRFMTSAGGWDKVVVTQVGGGPQPADVQHSWHVGNAQFGEFNGPDLFHLVDWDFGTSGTQTKQLILPEQNEFCTYQFCPFLFTTNRVDGVAGAGSNWRNFISTGMQLIGLSILGIPAGLYPNNTKLGTLQFRFRREGNRPLFTFTVAPLTNAIFTDRTFRNPALPMTYDWNFGDGSAHSAVQNPIHTFPSTGKYSVVLQTTDAFGTKIFDQFVILPLKADFSYTTRPSFHSGPITQLIVTDQSIGATTWDWDWGDGSPHGTGQVQPFPAHEYPRAQSFTVTLTVTDGAGHTSSISKPITT